MGATGASLALGLTVVVMAGVMGVVSVWAVRRTDRGPTHMLGGRDTFANIAWLLAMMALVVLAMAAGGSRPWASIVSWWTTPWPPTVSAGTAAILLAACYGLAAVWGHVPMLRRTNAAAASNYGLVVQRLSAVELVLVLVARYPVTVLVEETVFRGWLQHQLRFGVVLASLCFAAYHLVQWRTIPSLVPYCMAGGVIVAWTGNLWTAAAVHYVSDVVFALRTQRDAGTPQRLVRPEVV